MRKIVDRMNGLEDLMIKMIVKLDNLCANSFKKSNKNAPQEIDVTNLNTLGVPAESETDIQKLEENMKIDEFKQKLVRVLAFGLN